MYRRAEYQTCPQEQLDQKQNGQKNEEFFQRRWPAMIDHLARAENYRKRAASCRLVANQVSSAEFGKCYRSLADHYAFLAFYEEDFTRRAVAASLNSQDHRQRVTPPVSRGSAA